MRFELKGVEVEKTSNCLSGLFRLSNILCLFFAGAIVIVLMSILGVHLDLSGRSVMMLSQTVSPLVSRARAGSEFSDIGAFDQSQGWQTVRMRVTAYCPCAKCCGRFADGFTACNHRIEQGDVFVAADRQLGFATELVVPDYNNNQPVKVMDRGRLIRGNRLDVFFNSHRQAKAWGTRYLDVKITPFRVVNSREVAGGHCPAASMHGVIGGLHSRDPG